MKTNHKMTTREKFLCIYANSVLHVAADRLENIPKEKNPENQQQQFADAISYLKEEARNFSEKKRINRILYLLRHYS